MSDYPNGPQATLETASASPAGGPPGGAPPATGAEHPGPLRPGAPVWLVVVAAFVAVLFGVGATYAILTRTIDAANQRLARLEAEKTDLSTRVEGLRSEIASASAAAARLAAAAANSTPTGTVTPAKQLCLVTNVTGSTSSQYTLTADYVQLLTGAAAAKAATEHGDESPPPNDYYIVNDAKTLRTLELSKDASVLVLDWGARTGTETTKITVPQFVNVMPGAASPQDPWKSAYFWITVDGGSRVTAVEEQYFP